MPSVRHFNVPAGAMQELRTQAVFQALDRAAHRRLSLAQTSCSATEALAFGHGCKGKQAAHKSSIEVFHDLCVPVMAAITGSQ
jgi:hypothetical protein